MHRIIIGAAILGALASSVVARSAETPAAAGEVVPGEWQQHKVALSYVGFTSYYTCDALETDVRRILLHLGARKDAKVNASCPFGPEEPSRTAWINADFYTLAPAESASTAGVVNAHWAAREITPRQPFFMGDGDCELIEQMKDLISKNFSLRDVRYRTDCIPHEIVPDSFLIEGEVLIPVSQPAPG